MLRTTVTSIIPNGIEAYHKAPPTWVREIISAPAIPRLFRCEWNGVVYVIHSAQVLIEYNPCAMIEIYDSDLEKLRSAPLYKRPIIYNVHDREKILPGMRINPVEKIPDMRLPMPKADKSIYNIAYNIYEPKNKELAPYERNIQVNNYNTAYHSNLRKEQEEEPEKPSILDRVICKVMGFIQKI